MNSMRNQVRYPGERKEREELSSLKILTHISVITLINYIIQKGNVNDCFKGDFESRSKSDCFCKVALYGDH